MLLEYIFEYGNNKKATRRSDGFLADHPQRKEEKAGDGQV
jgi:hypothetical protein